MSIDPVDDLRAAAEPLRSTIAPTAAELGVPLAPAQVLVARAEARAAARARRRRRAALGIVAAASVAVATVAFLVRPSSSPLDTVPTPTASAPQEVYASASALLLAAAHASSEEPDRTDAHYWRVVSEVHQVEGVTHREAWLGRDRPTYIEQSEPYSSSPFQRRIHPWVTHVAGRPLDWDGLATLPTDVPTLRALLFAQSGNVKDPGTRIVVSFVEELLGEAPSPPALRAALWELLATLDGASVPRSTQDSAGRAAWAISIDVPSDEKVTFLVDPRNGELVEVRHASHRPGVPAWSMVWLERGPVDHVPARVKAFRGE